MKRVKIWTDGAAMPNPGACGAGIVLEHKGVIKELAIALGHGTNNTAELQAMIEALKALKESCIVTIYSDSQITVNCAMGIYKPSANLELWKEYKALVKAHDVTVTWIRKDSHEYNIRAHNLANEAIKLNK